MGGQTNGSLAPNLMGDTSESQQDAFVAKISPEGFCVWIRQFGSAKSDKTCRVRLDRSGNCYVAGNTNGSIDGAADDITGECPFVAKFDSTGQLLWIKQVRDLNAQTGLGVGVSFNGTVALACAPGYVATFDAKGVLVACKNSSGHKPLTQRAMYFIKPHNFNRIMGCFQL